MGAIEELGRYLPQMTEWRRHIHAHPELSFEETETTVYIAEQLRGMGLKPREFELGMPGPDLLAEGHGNRVLQVRAPELDDPTEGR